MTTTAEDLTVRKAVTVPLDRERAFELFTARIGEWWPVSTHSLHGEDVDAVVFERHAGGRMYERTTAGGEHAWARVVAFEPPARFVLEWQVNPARPATELEVRFTAADGGTRVDLEHRGLEEDRHRSYDTGWDEVLARFVGAAR